MLENAVALLQVGGGLLAIVVRNDAVHGGLGTVTPAVGELTAGKTKGLLSDDTEGNPGVVGSAEARDLVSLVHAFTDRHLVEFLEVARVRLVNATLLVHLPLTDHLSSRLVLAALRSTKSKLFLRQLACCRLSLTNLILDQKTVSPLAK